MAALAFKALSYGADKIPDSVFHSIPGGFFRPPEAKKSKGGRKDSRRKSDGKATDRGRKSRSSGGRNQSPATDYSDTESDYDDTDYEEDFRNKQRRRAKSLGITPTRSRSSSRGGDSRDYRKNSSRGEESRDRRRSTRDTRDRDRARDWDAEMDRAERGPEFPPPPTQGEYRPYNPADYAPVSGGMGAASGNDFYDRRESAVPPNYNPYPTQPPSRRGTAPSSSASRYTPAGYAPSPVNSPFPPPDPNYPAYNPGGGSVGGYPSPHPGGYSSPYPGTYASPMPGPYRPPPTSTYPSPPPFYRQSSRSQPSLIEAPYAPNEMAYQDPPIRHGSSSRHGRHEDRKRHRARSVGHRSRSRVTDSLRDRFGDLNLDSQEKKLMASTAGALAGGIAANAVHHGTLSTLVGVALGGLSGRELEKKLEKKKGGNRNRDRSRERDRSRSRDRSPDRDRSRRRRDSRPASPRDRYRGRSVHAGSDSYSDSESDRDRYERRRRGSRRD